MNRILISLAFALVPLLASASQHADGDYVVALVGNMSPDTVLRQHGLGASKKWTRAVHGFAAHLNGNQADRLEQDTRVQFIEPDVTVHEFAQTLPSGVRRIGCTNNARWLASSTTPIDVDVAVIDTGIELTHPDLNVFANTTFVTGTTTGNDDRGHGTHCAGIIGAKNNSIGVVGVAPGCRLWAVKVLDSGGNGQLSTIISGVDYVAQHAAEIEVANMSFGGQGSSGSLRLAVQNAVALGVVFVAAAGNDDFEIYGGDQILGTTDDFFPAAYPEVCTVSALADSDGVAGGYGANTSYGFDDTLATFSNYSITVDASNPVVSPGAAIDVAAPGVNIYSTYIGGSYTTMSGTSMAAPHVTGAVALYIAANGRATTANGVYAIRQALIDSAEPQTWWGINPTNPNHLDFNPEGLVNVAGNLVNAAPMVYMTSPLSGSTYAYGAVERFIGTARDSIDGVLSANIVWTSSLDGALGVGASLTGTLSPGVHTITATATDSAGLAGVRTATVTVNAASAPLNVQIESPAAGARLSVGNITCTASASDPIDGAITAIGWRSTVTGVIGNGTTLVYHCGTAGTNVITATVTNSLGAVASRSVGIYLDPNTPPHVVILTPVTGTSITSPATMTGQASDSEDGDLSANIAWTSSIDGALGTGASLTHALSTGTHVLTATVFDSGGAGASDRHTNTVGTIVSVPTVAITTPAAGSTYATTDLITFLGTAIDPVEGDIASRLDWSSSVSGHLGVGPTFSAYLIPGSHTITATAANTSGYTGTHAHAITVTGAAPPPLNHAPIITINSPSSGSSYPQGSTVPISGTASDQEDGDLSSVLQWSGPSGLFAVGPNASTNGLPVGVNVITASVQDSDGLVASLSRSVTITATNPPAVLQLTVTVACNKASYVNKEKALITTTVRQAGVAVPNSTVTVHVNTATKSVTTKTGTTTSAGTFAFYLPIQKNKYGTGSGPFTATVSASASKTGYVSGSGSTTFKVY